MASWQHFLLRLYPIKFYFCTQNVVCKSFLLYYTLKKLLIIYFCNHFIFSILLPAATQFKANSFELVLLVAGLVQSPVREVLLVSVWDRWQPSIVGNVDVCWFVAIISLYIVSNDWRIWQISLKLAGWSFISVCEQVYARPAVGWQAFAFNGMLVDSRPVVVLQLGGLAWG